MLSKANEQPTPSSPSIASSSNPLARALKAPVADVERNALANPLHLHYWGRTDPSYDLDSLGRQWLALRNRSLSTGSLSAALKCLHSGDAKPKSAIGAKRKAKATGKSPRQSLSQSAGELGASETERVFDACERSCAEWLLSRARAAGCLGIEFDESTVCDVCKSVSIYCIVYSFIVQYLQYSTRAYFHTVVVSNFMRPPLNQSFVSPLRLLFAFSIVASFRLF